LITTYFSLTGLSWSLDSHFSFSWQCW